MITTSPGAISSRNEPQAEVALDLEDEIVVNIQGDEPLIEGFVVEGAPDTKPRLLGLVRNNVVALIVGTRGLSVDASQEHLTDLIELRGQVEQVLHVSPQAAGTTRVDRVVRSVRAVKMGEWVCGGGGVCGTV